MRVQRALRFLLVAMSVGLGCAPLATASVKIAADARLPALQVDRLGNAQVSWTTPTGARARAVVDALGSVHYGAKLSNPNVAVRIPAEPLPGGLRSMLWQTPDGALWALQRWRRLRDEPVELRFSRWRGRPTQLTLEAVCCKWGSETVRGNASFHGKPICGISNTSTGNPLDPYGRNVYLDTYRAGAWQRMLGILTENPTGDYALWIRELWQGTAYRGTIAGPNWEWTLAPDARAAAASSLP